MPENKESPPSRKAWQNISDADFRLPLSDPEVFKKAVEKLPYPVHVHTPDGITVYMNAAGCSEYDVHPDEIIGRYSFAKDPEVTAVIRTGELQRVLAGETVIFPEVKFSFGSDQYRDITVFPLVISMYFLNTSASASGSRLLVGSSSTTKSRSR